MNKTYIVLSGSFVRPDGSVVGVGGDILLAEEQAKLHRHRLRLKPEEVATPAADMPAEMPADATPTKLALPKGTVSKAPDAKGND